MRLDRSKDMFVHVSICTSCNFNAPMPLCGGFGADKTCIFLRLVAKMSDRLLEQRFNNKFCVNLGNDASGICTFLSETYGGEVTKRPGVYE